MVSNKTGKPIKTNVWKTLDDCPYEVTPEIEDMYVRYKKQYDTVKSNTGKEPILTLLDD